MDMAGPALTLGDKEVEKVGKTDLEAAALRHPLHLLDQVLYELNQLHHIAGRLREEHFHNLLPSLSFNPFPDQKFLRALGKRRYIRHLESK